MESNADIKSYFTQYATPGIRNRVIDVLIGCGVRSMQELIGKDYVWLMTVFNDDTRGLALAVKLKDKYTKSVRMSELMAEGDHLIEAYFTENLPQNLRKGNATRLVRSLNRAGIETMKELCDASGDELRNVRYIGKASYKIILNMRAKYLAEQESLS